MNVVYVAYAMMATGTTASWFYPEAPRYLIKSNQKDRAYEVIQQIAKWNKASVPSNSSLDEQLESKEAKKDEETELLGEIKESGDDQMADED